MVKVITPIGAIVEVEETVYENNKDTLKIYSDEVKVEEPTDTAMTDVANTAMKSKSKK